MIADKKFWRIFAAGFLWGILFSFIFGVIYLRHALIREVRSTAGNHPETVAALAARINRQPGWIASVGSGCKVPKIPDGSRLEQVKLCHREYASALLQDDANRKVATFIPCTFAVYEKSDGNTYIARLNVRLLGALLGGVSGTVFPAKVEPEQAAILTDLTR
jgi:hypothetical protein